MSSTSTPTAPSSGPWAVGGGWSWPMVDERPEDPIGWRADITLTVVTVITLGLLGAPVGLLWGHLAPHAAVVVQSRAAYVEDFETKAFIGADGWFLLLTVTAGAVVGMVAFVLARRHGALTAIVLAGAGFLSAYIAWRVGHRVGLPAAQELLANGRDGARGEAPADLGAKGVLVGWSFGAVFVYGALSAALERR